MLPHQFTKTLPDLKVSLGETMILTGHQNNAYLNTLNEISETLTVAAYKIEPEVPRLISHNLLVDETHANMPFNSMNRLMMKETNAILN